LLHNCRSAVGGLVVVVACRRGLLLRRWLLLWLLLWLRATPHVGGDLPGAVHGRRQHRWCAALRAAWCPK
jgi:hypothetical protein